MPGDPHSGSKVWEAPDRQIGKSGKNRGKVVAHRNFQPRQLSTTENGLFIGLKTRGGSSIGHGGGGQLDYI